MTKRLDGRTRMLIAEDSDCRLTNKWGYLQTSKGWSLQDIMMIRWKDENGRSMGMDPQGYLMYEYPHFPKVFAFKRRVL